METYQLAKSEESEWAVLKGCAIAALDARGEESLAACRRYALKQLKKMDGELVPFDEARVVKFLLLYAKPMRYSRAASEAGISKADLVTAFDLWPEAKVVMNYVRLRNEKIREMDNEELIDCAREALERKLTDDECKLDGSTILKTLERLDKKSFGDPRVKQDEAEKSNAPVGGGITVNIIGDAAKVCAAPPEKASGKAAVFIDV